jgi:uncharacterized DUF497 family protein
MFEWDAGKRALNLEKHGLDFQDARKLFDGRPVISIPARTETEVRFLTVGAVGDGKLYTVVWTQRGDARRIISFRRSRHAEEAQYIAIHGRRA